MTRPVSTATPESVMKPIPAEIESGKSRSHGARTPLVSASGTPLKEARIAAAHVGGDYTCRLPLSRLIWLGPGATLLFGIQADEGAKALLKRRRADTQRPYARHSHRESRS